MAGGSWDILELPQLPGLYMNFRAAALAAIVPGARGVVMVPVKAHWGPEKSFQTITRESQITDIFTADDTNGATAYKTCRFALMGGAKEVIAYRLIDGDAAKATLTLMDTAVIPVGTLKLDAIYRGARGNSFKITVAVNAVDGTKKDIKLYEGTTLLRTFSFISGTIAAAVAAINNDTGNKWIAATLLGEGNGILANIAASPMTDGNSGITGIVAQDYTDAFTAFEAREFNLVAMDGVTDSGIQASFKAWVERVRSEGKYVIGVIGGSATDDKGATAVATAVARSAAQNYEGIVNIGCGAYLGGVEYSSAELAPWAAGLIAGQRLRESTTYASAPFSDVNRRWTRTELKEANAGGVFLPYHDGLIVKVLRGINTLITLRQDQKTSFKKIRAIRVMDAIAMDCQAAAERNYIGKINNNADGRLALVSAMKVYMETLAKGEVIERTGWAVYLDPDYYGADAELLPDLDPAKMPEPEDVFIKYEARITDVIERIFGSFSVK